ncbi:autophagy-related protein 16-1-like [Corticium candelabrum]|uniref:autophagy-related protein 16-1-like n=1 Tax=Corticium candelabrum TaxID=121492 RepID=UPI002E26F7FE|nr:autophagy-related protein 16-1-like [Corticium candelabrum]
MATSDFRSILLSQLKVRSKKEGSSFAEIIRSHNKLFESYDSLKSRISQLEVECTNLRQDNLELARRPGSGDGTSSVADRERIMRLHVELNDLHRKKSENADQIIEMTKTIQVKEELIHKLEAQLQETTAEKREAIIQANSFRQALEDVEKANQVLKDEQQALQLACNAQDEKLKKLQHDNHDLVERWMAQKAKDADKMNRKNEEEATKARLTMAQQEVIAGDQEQSSSSSAAASAIAAIKQGPSALLRRLSTKSNAESSEEVSNHQSVCYNAIIPAVASQKFDAHDGEVVAVKFSTSGRLLATGGSDRKIKLWETLAGKQHEKGTLLGSNAGITSVEFDLQEKLVLGSSNDHSARVWGVTDQRCRHALTGHSNKVMTARFLGGDAIRVVTGSHDRTLKVWDLRSKSCVKTIFAGSSCNDLVVSDGAGACVISGHFDKRIRFWDIRSDASANEISLQGKVTSLDLSPDRTLLLSSSRDDTLKLIDLRMNQVTGTFSADGFKVGVDYTRACFSPDGMFVAAGSQDGSLFVWQTQTGKLEKTVREHSSCVVACTWHPSGSSLVSCDRTKKCIFWSDH